METELIVKCATFSPPSSRQLSATSAVTVWVASAPDSVSQYSENLKVEVLRRCAELLNVGDWDALFELYHPDVRVEFRDLQPPPEMPELLQGREALRRVVAHWTEPYDEFGAEVYETSMLTRGSSATHARTARARAAT
jgi:hypothetical protein